MKVFQTVKDNLVDDAKDWWRMATVRFWILLAVLAQLAEIILPYSGLLSPAVANALTIIAVVSIALRLYKQKSLSNDLG